MTKLTSEELQQANTLTLRENITLRILILMVRVLSPIKWSHELSAPLDEIAKQLSGKTK